MLLSHLNARSPIFSSETLSDVTFFEEIHNLLLEPTVRVLYWNDDGTKIVFDHNEKTKPIKEKLLLKRPEILGKVLELFGFNRGQVIIDDITLKCFYHVCFKRDDMDRLVVLLNTAYEKVNGTRLERFFNCIEGNPKVPTRAFSTSKVTPMKVDHGLSSVRRHSEAMIKRVYSPEKTSIKHFAPMKSILKKAVVQDRTALHPPFQNCNPFSKSDLPLKSTRPSEKDRRSSFHFSEDYSFVSPKPVQLKLKPASDINDSASPVIRYQKNVSNPSRVSDFKPKQHQARVEKKIAKSPVFKPKPYAMFSTYRPKPTLEK
ncbi:hypothetical protein DSO57_1019124 [Entomophthora muscae]|uniref:Uncharacterized protein n=2 Tax=Entomophthora muscae TaxID=34485 RepID=A0ACC2UPT5_9FUNG|nr:hypothetical protein DSO57_1003269 [Entomophthora muscae]KAJ9088848.1 hypothetical protein DSO57_1019124 [Entomophthora muscae]